MRHDRADMGECVCACLLQTFRNPFMSADSRDEDRTSRALLVVERIKW